MSLIEHDIAKELLKHIKLAKDTHDDEQAFLYDLVESVDAQIADEIWDTLDSGVHVWYNDARDAYNDDVSIPLFPGMESEQTKPQQKPQRKIKPPHKKISAGTRIKQIMTESDMEIRVPVIAEKMATEGFTISRMTVETSAAEFRQSVRVLKAAGYLPGFGDKL